MAIGNCDCCDRKNVPVTHHETDYERGHVGDVTQCYVCAGDVPDPYGELEDDGCLLGYEREPVACRYCGAMPLDACKGKQLEVA